METSLSQRSSLTREFRLLLDSIINRSKGILLTDHLFDHAFKMIEKYTFLQEVNTIVYKGASYINYNFLSVCALYHYDFPSIVHIFEGIHRPFRPMIDVLLNEDITHAKMLLKYGFKIIVGGEYCIRDKIDETFEYGKLDLIDVLIEHNKHKSIYFIKDVINKAVLFERDRWCGRHRILWQI